MPIPWRQTSPRSTCETRCVSAPCESALSSCSTTAFTNETCAQGFPRSEDIRLTNGPLRKATCDTVGRGIPTRNLRTTQHDRCCECSMTRQTINAQRIYSPISCAGLALQDVPLAPRISIEAQDPGMGDDALCVNTLHLCLCLLYTSPSPRD